MFVTGINAKENISHFEELAGILMQEKEKGLTLKPQSADLALMARKNFYKGKEVHNNKTEQGHINGKI